MTTWHIITGEYPPQHGGVSDYTRRVARGLVEAGDRVQVWAPPAHGPERVDPGVAVRRLPDRFGPRSLRVLSCELDRLPAPRRILVQYVPHAFGWKGANVPFCLWLQSRRADSIWVMFHEVAFPFDRDQAVSRNALAAVNRLMASIVASSAERAFVSIPGWQPAVQAMMGPGKPVDWLPVPSSIPLVSDPAGSTAVHAHYAGARKLVGHFSTLGRAVRDLLAVSIPALVAASDCHVLLLGRRSDEVRRELVARHPRLEGRLHGTGMLSDDAVSAALSHGVPMVTTSGWLTEHLWDESGATMLVPADEAAALGLAAARLLDSAPQRAEMRSRARDLYSSRFDVVHSIAALRAADKGSRRPVTAHA